MRATYTNSSQVESVGEGVTSVAIGDHVIPLYTAGGPSDFLRVTNDTVLMQNALKNVESASCVKAGRRISVARVCGLDC